MRWYRTVVGLMVFGALFLLPPAASAATPGVPPAGGPTLSIPRRIAAAPGQQVTVPMTYAGGGSAISAVVFRIDFPATDLSLDPTDRDGDGTPDAIHAKVPAGFTFKVSYNASGDRGQLDFFIADLVPPLGTLPDGTVVEMGFLAGQPRRSVEVPVAFSGTPAPSFGSTTGQSVPGTWSDGSVLIAVGAASVPTPLPATALAAPPQPTRGQVPAAPAAEQRAAGTAAASVASAVSGSARPVATTSSAPTAVSGGAVTPAASPVARQTGAAQTEAAVPALATPAPAMPAATSLAGTIGAVVPTVTVGPTPAPGAAASQGQGGGSGTQRLALALVVAAAMMVVLWFARSRLGR